MNPDESRRCIMAKTVTLGILGSAATLALMGAVLFGSAGRWDLPMFWACLGVWTASTLGGMFVVDPALIKERMRPGPGGKDYLSVFVLIPLWLGQCAVAGLDVGRFHWSDT